MSTSIDLSRTSGLVNLGTHTFQVTERSREDMGPSGDACWYIICKVISAGDDQGKELLHTISLGHKSRWKMDEFLDGIGAPKKGKATLEEFVGKKFRASVNHDVYQGKQVTKLETIIAAADVQGSMDTLLSETTEEDAALPDDVLEAEEEPAGRRVGRNF